MPVHELKCGNCEHVFEVMGSYVGREKVQTCPKGSGTEVKQAISLFSAKPPSNSFSAIAQDRSRPRCASFGRRVGPVLPIFVAAA